MSKQVINGLWASDDGSYGDGNIVIVNTTEWTKKQWSWYERLNESGEVYDDDLASIDDNIKPEFN